MMIERSKQIPSRLELQLNYPKSAHLQGVSMLDEEPSAAYQIQESILDVSLIQPTTSAFKSHKSNLASC